jgi:hypothetical protein
MSRTVATNATVMIATPASTLRPIRPGRQRLGRAGHASPITSSADAASVPPGVRTQTTSESWQRSETQVTTRPVFPRGRRDAAGASS